MKKTFIIFISLFIIILNSSFVSAHGFGSSIEIEADGVLIDIGYDPEEVFAGETVIYDFSIVDPVSKAPLEFTDIWVRISEGRKTHLATGIAKSNLGKTTLAYIYPEGGDYEMSVRFSRSDKADIETSIPLPVLNNEESSPKGGIVEILFGASIGLFLGFGVTYFIIKRTRKNNENS